MKNKYYPNQWSFECQSFNQKKQRKELCIDDAQELLPSII